MAATRCLHNSRAALYRVFVSPLEAGEASHVLGRSVALARQHPQLWRPQNTPGATQQPPGRRCFSTSPALSAPRPSKRGALPDRLPIDFEIRDRTIMLVGPDNKISGPHNTQQVLKSIDTAVFSLRMIQRRDVRRPADPDKPAPAPSREGGEHPLCRVVNKADEWRRERERSKEKKASERMAKIKELEVSWAIAENDLARQLKQLKGFLEKGLRVDVMLQRKKGARRATEAEMEAVIAAVRAAAAEVPGARERKEMSGVLGKRLFIYFEAQPQKGGAQKGGEAKGEPEGKPQSKPENKPEGSEPKNEEPKSG